MFLGMIERTSAFYREQCDDSEWTPRGYAFGIGMMSVLVMGMFVVMFILPRPWVVVMGFLFVSGVTFGALSLTWSFLFARRRPNPSRVRGVYTAGRTLWIRPDIADVLDPADPVSRMAGRPVTATVVGVNRTEFKVNTDGGVRTFMTSTINLEDRPDPAFMYKYRRRSKPRR